MFYIYFQYIYQSTPSRFIWHCVSTTTIWCFTYEKMCPLIARDSFIFRRQQLEQSVYCEPESRRATTADDDRQDVQGANHEKVKVSSAALSIFRIIKFFVLIATAQLTYDCNQSFAKRNYKWRKRKGRWNFYSEKFVTQSTTQDLFELLERVQSSRLDDQRCVLPSYFSQVCDKIYSSHSKTCTWERNFS